MLLMTRHYQNLGNSLAKNLLHPIRGTTQIWVLTRVISMEFLSSFPRLHFEGKPMAVSRNVGSFFSQATNFYSPSCKGNPGKKISKTL